MGFDLKLSASAGYGYPDFIAPCTTTYANGDLTLTGTIRTTASSSGVNRTTTVILHDAENLGVGDTFLAGEFDAKVHLQRWRTRYDLGRPTITGTVLLWGYEGGTTGQITVEAISGSTVLLRVSDLRVVSGPNSASPPLVFDGTIETDLPTSYGSVSGSGNSS